jgi:hypothetical protein
VLGEQDSNKINNNLLRDVKVTSGSYMQGSIIELLFQESILL